MASGSGLGGALAGDVIVRTLLVFFAFAAISYAAAPPPAAQEEVAVLNLSPRAEAHVREGHFPGGKRSRGKSLFLPDADLTRLLKAAAKTKPRRQPNGRDKRVTGAGQAIGTDGRSGKPVRTCVVISEPDGTVVTMYPGR